MAELNLRPTTGGDGDMVKVGMPFTSGEARAHEGLWGMTVLWVPMDSASPGSTDPRKPRHEGDQVREGLPEEVIRTQASG